MFGDRSWGILWEQEASLFLDLVLPALFWRRAGRSAAQEIEDFTCRSEKIQGRNCACSSPKAPPSCLHVAGSEQGYGLGCPVCPAPLPVSGELPMLSDGCFSLSVVALHYYLIFHASSAACDSSFEHSFTLQNLRMKVGWVGSPFSHQVAHACFCSKNMY